MLKINKNEISLTRGDVATINVTAQNSDGSNYKFKQGEVVRLNIFKKKDCHSVILTKDIEVEEESEVASISLSSSETKIGQLINKPTEYWYEVVLNPETAPQTIIGYYEEPAIFRLLPEGGDSE